MIFYDKPKRCSMYITEQYHLYRLAYQLVFNDEYEVLHMNDQTGELWLEKYDRKSSKIIRIIHRGFDWKNQLKTDIAHVFQRVKSLKKYFTNKHVDIYNVYITSYEPVDDWEGLKKPIVLNDKKLFRMKVFYLSKENFEEEKTRLLEQIGATKNGTDEVPIFELENEIERYKQDLYHSFKSRQEKIKNVFTFGKPRFSYLLIIINIFIFIALELTGGSTNVEHLVEFGAKFNPAIISGEWWRIITSMFLHIGMFHLFMNMLALYYLGTAVESIYGSSRFLIIYFLSGIGGGLTSFAFNFHVAAGASGALFGLFGALLYFGTVEKRLFRQTMGRNLILILMINIIFGFMIPQIDMGAHLGGLIAGFIASGITSVPKHRLIKRQIIYFILYTLITIFLIWYGILVNLHFLYM